MGIWGLQIGVVAILPSIKCQLISIKLAFLSMKIVQNYKENIIRSASDSTDSNIFLLKIKNSVWFMYPLPHKAQYFAVHCNTLYPEALCIPCSHHFP